MKQKFFMMLAAMLLSIGAFAQSGNQPLKGDVNEDGRVDVADIVAIVDIILKGGSTPQPTTYYWYVGTSTTEPTIENYQTILTRVDENNNPYTFTNTNVRHYMYIVVRDTKSVASIKDGQFDTGYAEYTNITIPDCKVYRSNSAISLNHPLVITIE